MTTNDILLMAKSTIDDNSPGQDANIMRMIGLAVNQVSSNLSPQTQDVVKCIGDNYAIQLPGDCANVVWVAFRNGNRLQKAGRAINNEVINEIEDCEGNSTSLFINRLHEMPLTYFQERYGLYTSYFDDHFVYEEQYNRIVFKSGINVRPGKEVYIRYISTASNGVNRNFTEQEADVILNLAMEKYYKVRNPRLAASFHAYFLAAQARLQKNRIDIYTPSEFAEALFGKPNTA